MPKSGNIEIKILGNAAVITHPSEGGMCISKTVKLGNLLRCFADMSGGVETPILPENCIKYKEEGNSTILALYHRQAKFTATIDGIKYENCIRPNIVMVYTLTNKGAGGWSMRDTRAFGILEDRLLVTPGSALLNLPFPNIGGGGWICWGSNSISGTFRSLTGLTMLCDRLFAAPFNNHLYSSAPFKHLGINSHIDFFKYLQNKDNFPTEMLAKNPGRQMVLGDI